MRKAHVQLLGSIQSIFLYCFVLLACVFSLFVLTSHAAGETGAEISLAWDRNTESDLKGYKIYYKTGTSGKPYDGTGAFEGDSPVIILVSELDDSNTPSYKLTQLQHGTTYHLTLTAFNNEDVESEYSNEVSVTTNTVIVNHTPTANAGLDQTKNEGVTVYLDGLNSSDPEDNIDSYQWRQTSGPSVTLSNSNQVKASFTAPDVGPDGASLTFELTVTDAEGLSDIDICIVNISWLNVAPMADAGSDQTVNEGVSVNLSGLKSVDEDDAVLNYNWTQINGPAVTLLDANTAEPYFTAPDVSDTGASLTFNLRVTDGGGLASNDVCVVNVTWLNEAPTAFAGTNQVADAGDTVILDGSGSSDPDDGIAKYQWVQTSGPIVSLSGSLTQEASFLVPEDILDDSSLSFELTVTDQGGLNDSDACQIDIKLSIQDNTGSQGDTDTTNTSNNGKKDEPKTNNSSTNNNGTDNGNSNKKKNNDLTEMDTSPTIVFIDDTEDNGSTGADKKINKDKNSKNESPDQDQTTGEDTNTAIDSEVDEVTNDLAGNDKTDTSIETDNEDNPTNDESDGETGTQPIIIETTTNEAPYQPAPVSPLNGAVVQAGVCLTANGFMDSDVDDTHYKTQWQIIEKSSGICMLNVTSTTYLTSIDVPEHLLSEDTGYYWRARFFDNHGNASSWSTEADFYTAYSGEDSDGNGVPDDQDPDVTVDMDGDSVPDIEQAHIRSIALPNSTQHIGLSVESCPTVEGILTMEAIDPAETPEIAQEADELPYGLINFKLDVCNPGDVATVTVFFEEPAPAEAKWVKYDQLQAVWVDYTEHATFSEDRMSVVLEFKDGGYGDDDGIENGIIVDPSGLEVISAAQTVQVETTGGDSVQSSSGGGGGGCFIECTGGETGALPQPLKVLALIVVVTLVTIKPKSSLVKKNG